MQKVIDGLDWAQVRNRESSRAPTCKTLQSHSRFTHMAGEFAAGELTNQSKAVELSGEKKRTLKGYPALIARFSSWV